eukprot:scaffold48_cov311-Pinguiococcus_pyrenoidosus.AAC.260
MSAQPRQNGEVPNVALVDTPYEVVGMDKIVRKAGMPPCPPDQEMQEQTLLLEKVAEFVEQRMKIPRAEGGLGFQEFWIPTDDAEAKTSVLLTEDWSNATKLLVVIQNASGAQMGIWSRSLALKMGLRTGSMLPYLERAVQDGFGVLVLRPNANSVYIQDEPNARPRKMLIEGSSSPSEHAIYVWDNVVRHAAARHICLLGIGAGGALAKELLQREMVRVKEAGEGEDNRIAGICTIEASSILDADEAADTKDFLNQFAVNFDSSEAPMGYRLPSVALRLGCTTMSVGPIPEAAEGNTGWSPSAALESTFRFLTMATRSNERVTNLGKKFARAEARAMSLDPKTAEYTPSGEDSNASHQKTGTLGEAENGGSNASQDKSAGLFSRLFRKTGGSNRANGAAEGEPNYDPANGPQASREVQLQEAESLGVEDFDLLKVVGKGAFGKVMMVRKKEGHDGGRIFAMKVLKKSVVIAKGQVEHTKTERSVLMEIRHPYVVRLRYAFQTEDKLYLITDYYNGGSLFYHLRKSRGFSEQRAKFYAAELLLALEHLHKQHIVYRDLKLENVLMDHDGHIALTDFGLSKMGVDESRGASTFCGTAEYIAPELLRGLRYGAMVDWWSFGILLYEMMAGRTPFYDKNRKLMFYNIINCDPHFPPTFSDAACTALRGLLIRDPAERLGGGKSGADAIKAQTFFSDIDFDALLRKDLSPPYLPDVHSEVDTKYVPKSYLEAEAKDSEVAPSAKTKPGETPDFTEFTYMGEKTTNGDDGDDTDDA